ncbi:hypothetical protein HAX54_052891 [Datura stramonium]|uniref:Uncharacterized protein n=1 Tax=Datura stramonium TaxID=4076 RepID=A0ABS8SZK0_DATST|nr:hypothetical protein [Datura stramonium]
MYRQLERQMEQKSIVEKQRPEEDQCISIATRSGRTTFEQQTLGTRAIAKENNLGQMEAREQSSALSDPHTGRRDAPTVQGTEQSSKECDMMSYQCCEEHNT